MVEKAADIAGEGISYGDLAWAYSKAGKPEDVKKVLAKALAPTEGKTVATTSIAAIYSVLGDKDKAIEWLEKSYEQRSGYLPSAKVDFVFENVHDDPKFRALMGKLGLS